MEIQNRADSIRLFSLGTPQMRAFHMTWLAFFTCFFGWFGVAPLMAIVREDLGLTKAQIGNTIIASVAITVLVRILIGPLCDRVGPRRVYAWLLMIGALPVMSIGLADSYESFLLFRLAIGAIGAAFVVTQYHTSVMFAPNCIGTANATAAGWGNLGGGVTQMAMPLIFAGFLFLGFDKSNAWRFAMIVPGVALFLAGIAYYKFTQDAPDGDFRDLRAAGRMAEPGDKGMSSISIVAKDPRVWILALAYACCFGLELTMDNVAALYFHDRFGLGLEGAGIVAGLFGMMNLFARALGGLLSDYVGNRRGVRGRVQVLFAVLLLEGIMLILFSQMAVLSLSIATMLIFGLFVKMSNGATYGVVPFVDSKRLGAIAGIVGAGGNIGAVSAGFLFRVEGVSTETAFLILGLFVFFSSFVVLSIRLAPAPAAATERPTPMIEPAAAAAS